MTIESWHVVDFSDTMVDLSYDDNLRKFFEIREYCYDNFSSEYWYDFIPKANKRVTKFFFKSKEAAMQTKLKFCK